MNRVFCSAGVASRAGWVSSVAVSLAVLSACSTAPTAPKAPVVDRPPVRTAPTSPVPPAAAPGSGPTATTPAGTVQPAAPALPGAENAGKPGYHTVRPGETLTRIALQYNQDRRNLQNWNQLANPDLIEVGQVLRVVPPGVDPGATPVVTAPVPTPRPLPPVATAPARPATPAPAPAAAAPAGDIGLIWPAQGNLLSRFDEKNRGITIEGRLGDPVVAAADGVVAIAGSPIRGLGNLVIIQHAGGVITAYAHNQTLLVKEDQQVKQGQRIAEMGSSDTDRVKLHFEVRRQGKPIDPLSWLPKR